VNWWTARKHFASYASGMTGTAPKADGLFPAHPERN
jgi:hypothetical protein